MASGLLLHRSGFFAEAFPHLEKTVYTWGNLGRITLPQVLGVSHWVIIPLFIVGALLLFWWLEKKDCDGGAWMKIIYHHAPSDVQREDPESDIRQWEDTERLYESIVTGS